MSQFRDAYDEFRREGVEVAAISVDSPYSHRAWSKELGGIPYPLLSDFAREFLEQYGVPENTAGLLPRTARRSAFVIDSEGIVRYVWYPPEGRGLPPIDEILEAVRALPPREVSTS
ncbi:MAG TPA: redoxin domain-containing protein [Chloroflexota bacterium]